MARYAWRSGRALGMVYSGFSGGECYVFVGDLSASDRLQGCFNRLKTVWWPRTQGGGTGVSFLPLSQNKFSCIFSALGWELSKTRYLINVCFLLALRIKQCLVLLVSLMFA